MSPSAGADGSRKRDFRRTGEQNVGGGDFLPEMSLARTEWEHYATAMKSLHIRDVPEPTIARLKRRALLHHRSLQGELIFVLEEAAKQIPHEEPAEFALNTVKTQGTQDWSREGIYED